MSTTGGPKTEAHELRGLSAILASPPVVLVSLLGAIAYVVTRLSQTSFYSKFGVEPEDVGLSYEQTLTRAAPSLLILSLVAGLVTLGFWELVFRRILRRPRSPVEKSMPSTLGPLPPPPHGRARRRFSAWIADHSLMWSAVQFTTVALLVLAIWMPFAGDFKANDVKEGRTVRPAGLSTIHRLITNPLAIRVERVRVSWIDEMKAVYDFSSSDVMYLGRADGVAVFVDPRNDRTIHVPDSSIVIEREP